MSSLMLIDTDIVSYFLKGRNPEVDERFAEADPSFMYISVVTEAELLYGLKRLDPLHRLHQAVRQFLADINALVWDRGAAEAYAAVRHQLFTSGTLIGELDMMIAAHAISQNATLVTNNTRHFARLAPTLTTENWASNPALSCSDGQNT